ncbi:MAG: AAA family ATPase [candidate division Zixibacteria bacterium]|nr:AAA family ATPase [candidate division Zixibacteria bacterium]
MKVTNEKRGGTSGTFTARLYIPDNSQAAAFYGSGDQNLKRAEAMFGVQIVARGNELVIRGDEEAVDRVADLFERVLESCEGAPEAAGSQINYALDALREDPEAELEELLAEAIPVPSRRRFIRPRTAGQRVYARSIRDHTIIFAIGPAGTGKTYIAMAMAVDMLMREEVRRLVLVRPAVEAGEKLGYLPGDFTEKVAPYLRPLYDALHDMMDFDRAMRLVERGIVEVVPLAYMRGRTLNESFVVLDEAQNTTYEQMKMFLTRLGFGSKAVVTGDITQIDLDENVRSGLVEVQDILKGIDGTDFVYLTRRDVVRHPIIQRVVDAYDNYEAKHRADRRASAARAGKRRPSGPAKTGE